MDETVHHLCATEQRSITRLRRGMEEQLSLPCGRSENIRLRLLDTFDWRLYRAGYLLEARSNSDRIKLLLRCRNGKACLYSDGPARTRLKAGDLPGKKLQSLLAPLLKERALIAMADLPGKTAFCEITDREGKITARLETVGVYFPGGGRRRRALAAYIAVQPLRGYEKDGERIVARLSRALQLGRTEPADTIFPRLDIRPAAYSSKVNVRLDREMSATEAVTRVLTANLDIMEQNLPGIFEEIDIEFLHDFRIASRRSRTLVDQVRGVFPAEPLDEFKAEFSRLSRLTSRPRDLDVFLSDIRSYTAEIRQTPGADLEPMKTQLMRHREKEYRHLLAELDSERFRRFLIDWRAFIIPDRKGAVSCPGDNIPVVKVAGKSIRRNYRKMLRQGEKASLDYNYESIHRLRKTGKRLRYLIDAFSSLYPDRDIARELRSLKKLQNNLGSIVDMHVQRDLLGTWKARMERNPGSSPGMLSAMETLMALTDKNEARAASAYRKQFQRFSSRANQRRFRDLFG